MFPIKSSSLWLPFFSGVLLSLTLPMFGVWPLVWVALIPLFVFASNSALTRGRLVSGMLLFGLPYAAAVIFPLLRITSWWWTSSASSLGADFRALEFGFIVCAIGVWGALFFIPLGFALRHFGEKQRGMLIIPLCFVFIEWLRSSFALFGYSWGVLGYTLLDTQYLKYLAGVTGVYGLSLLTVLGNLALLEIGRLFAVRTGGLRERLCNTFGILIDTPRQFSIVWLFVAAFVFTFGFGVLRDFSLNASPSCPVPLRVAVVSSTIPTDDSIGEGAYRNYRAKILASFADGAQLVVLPENAFPFFEIDESTGALRTHPLIILHNRDELYADFRALTQAHREASVAVGLHTWSNGDHYNSLVVFRGGAPIAYYHKRKLVPFAEYAPLGLPLPIVERLTAGAHEQYFSVNNIRATGLMCSEVSDATIPLGAAALIIAPSNDSVFASDAIALVHHRMARMRALEAGAYLVRASKGGISSIIDSSGVALQTSRDQVLVADICPSH